MTDRDRTDAATSPLSRLLDDLYADHCDPRESSSTDQDPTTPFSTADVKQRVWRASPSARLHRDGDIGAVVYVDHDDADCEVLTLLDTLQIAAVPTVGGGAVSSAAVDLTAHSGILGLAERLLGTRTLNTLRDMADGDDRVIELHTGERDELTERWPATIHEVREQAWLSSRRISDSAVHRAVDRWAGQLAATVRGDLTEVTVEIEDEDICEQLIGRPVSVNDPLPVIAVRHEPQRGTLAVQVGRLTHSSANTVTVSLPPPVGKIVVLNRRPAEPILFAAEVPVPARLQFTADFRPHVLGVDPLE